ncbi:MAG: DNA mismatch repair endonuclease MutL [Clostridiales bacterium]|nr:DNA mismatch repair endonuclease MutL [Clostridiales bacterium]
MGKIKLLDKDTINKIAAGEVVERPVSVVKELIENSIDAGATMISCEIKDGGRTFIRITDNGCGFASEDIEIAFLRHSTSKIRGEEDLTNIKSLGFRGEALSSISAVSRVELLTKTADDFFGHRFICEGGENRSFEDAGTPNGTTIIVRDLFFNVPARRKFLKSAMTEAGYINDTVNRLAESHPDISFRFINQGKTILFTNGNCNEKDTLYSIYGRDIASNLIKVNCDSPECSITGYIGKPCIMRGNRVHENYYINGRYSKSVIITKAIEEAYKGYSMQHKYPFTSLHFEFPLEKLDINVHPTKMEVRLLDGDFYYNKIYQTILYALKSSNMIVDAGYEKTAKNTDSDNILDSKPFPFEQSRINDSSELNNKSNIPSGYSYNNSFNVTVPDSFKEKDYSYNEPTEIKLKKDNNIVTCEVPVKASIQPEISDFTQLSFDDKESFMNDKEAIDYKIVGQIFNTYWIVELNETIFCIDQHAAHEKIIYERILKRYRNRETMSQQIFPPVVVTLSLLEIEVLKRYREYIEKLGFEISEFGGREYNISAVPTDLFGLLPEDFFNTLLDSLFDSPVKGEMDFIVDKIAGMACKAAIKGNMSISSSVANEVIKELLQLENPYNCPHGRPVIISISKKDIEKKFKRII